MLVKFNLKMQRKHICEYWRTAAAQILGNSEFWAKPVFKDVSMFLFYSFEKIDIFYFNLKSAW